MVFGIRFLCPHFFGCFFVFFKLMDSSGGLDNGFRCFSGFVTEELPFWGWLP